MSVTVWKKNFRALNVDTGKMTEEGDVASGKITYTSTDATCDVAIEWGAGEVPQQHDDLPVGSTVEYWPDKQLVKIVRV